MKSQEFSANLHDRARHLIDQQRIEGLQEDDRQWLQDHLLECDACATRAAQTEVALQELKSLSAGLPRGLAASTSLLVREEAIKLKVRRRRTLALVAGCAVSWMAGVASAPLVWKVCEWAGATLDLPRIVWQLGFFTWWLLPAAAVGLIVLWTRTNWENEGYFDLMGLDSSRNKQ